MSTSDVPDPLEPRDHDGFEYKVVRAVRGLESRTIAKWEDLGWELMTREAGPVMRTDLRFRRVWPRTPGAWVTKRVEAFGRMTPLEKFHAVKVPGAVLVGLVLVLVLVGSLTSGGDDEPTTAPTKAVVTKATKRPTPEAATATTPEPTKAPATTKATPTETRRPAGPLTVENSKDLEELLAADDDYDLAAAFAKKYSGEEIEFDGNIADLQSYADGDDILVYAGDFSTTSARGPSFKFEEGSEADGFGEGDNVRVVALVGEFNDLSGLFFLEPVSTRPR